MKSGSLDCLKYLMFFFNLLFFICGAATLAVGIWAAVSATSFKDILGENDIIFDGVYIIIGVGGALFLMGFLGCCGAIKESRCLLAMFFVFVLIIFIAEIVGSILVIVNIGKVETYALDSMSKYNQSTSADDVLITSSWDTFQATIGCCGYNNYSDWENNAVWANSTRDKVPASCCTREVLSLDSKPTNEEQCLIGNTNFINTEGCKVKLSNYVWVVGGVGIGILLVELLGMIFACCLYRAIED